MNEAPRNHESATPAPLFFDSVANRIFVSNPVTGRFIEINQPGCSMFGYTKSELVGRDIETLSSGVFPYTGMPIAWIEKAHRRTSNTWMALQNQK